MRRITFSAMRGWIITVNQWGVVASSLVVLLTIFIQVVLRYVFHHPLLGMEEIAIMAVLWLWFFAAALASQKEFHISGGLPVTRQSIRDIMDMVYPFICLVVTLVFGYLCFVYCVWVVEGHVISGGLFIPWIWTTVGAFLGLVLNAVYLTQQTVAKLGAFRQARQRGSQNDS